MGFKAFCIFTGEFPIGYFGQTPPILEQKTEEIRHFLGLGSYEKTGQEVFESAMYPREGELYLAAYEHGAVICDSNLPALLYEEPDATRIFGEVEQNCTFLEKLLSLYPRGETLTFILHSIVDLWGYVKYEGSQRVRMVAGAADEGILVNKGELLPEEERFLAGRPLDADEVYGEDLVFEVTRPLFGSRLDETAELKFELFKYQKSQERHNLFSLFKRWFK